MPRPAAAAAERPRRSGPLAEVIRAYLILYNFLSFFGWVLILFSLLKHLAAGPQTSTAVHRFAEWAIRNFRPIRLVYLPTFGKNLPAPVVIVLHRAATAQQYIGGLVSFVQSFAVLEVVHAALGLVRSPVSTTAMQVSSRLFSVWLVAEKYANASVSPWYAPMVLAWSITECVRYPFYAQQLLQQDAPLLLWARYSLFYVLYPLGAISEAMLIAACLPADWPWVRPKHWDYVDYTYAGLFFYWWCGLYVMYTYMMRQRKKALGTGFWGSTPAAREAQRKVKDAPATTAAGASALASSVQAKAQQASKRR
ncbi:hypothetical protein V8E36_008109 [Tilletia maclaganii]